jgi:hypothetical protein
MSAHGKARVFGAKTVVVTEGDRGGALYVILEGRCKAYVSDEEGREAVLSVMGPGEYFGEITLDDGPRSASVITLELAKLLIVPQADLRPPRRRFRAALHRQAHPPGALVTKAVGGRLDAPGGCCSIRRGRRRRAWSSACGRRISPAAWDARAKW